MEQFIEVLSRYCAATNINVPVLNENIEVYDLFFDALKRGYITTESFHSILEVLKNN